MLVPLMADHNNSIFNLHLTLRQYLPTIQTMIIHTSQKCRHNTPTTTEFDTLTTIGHNWPNPITRHQTSHNKTTNRCDRICWAIQLNSNDIDNKCSIEMSYSAIGLCLHPTRLWTRIITLHPVDSSSLNLGTRINISAPRSPRATWPPMRTRLRWITTVSQRSHR